jgi:hypothetical protein
MIDPTVNALPPITARDAYTYLRLEAVEVAQQFHHVADPALRSTAYLLVLLTLALDYGQPKGWRALLAVIPRVATITPDSQEHPLTLAAGRLTARATTYRDLLTRETFGRVLGGRLTGWRLAQ